MVAQQWLNNRTVYLDDFAACSLPTNLRNCTTEDYKLVVRLQMQNTLGIVVIGQLDE